MAPPWCPLMQYLFTDQKKKWNQRIRTGATLWWMVSREWMPRYQKSSTYSKHTPWYWRPSRLESFAWQRFFLPPRLSANHVPRIIPLTANYAVPWQASLAVNFHKQVPGHWSKLSHPISLPKFMLMVRVPTAIAIGNQDMHGRTCRPTRQQQRAWERERLTRPTKPSSTILVSRFFSPCVEDVGESVSPLAYCMQKEQRAETKSILSNIILLTVREKEWRTADSTRSHENPWAIRWAKMGWSEILVLFSPKSLAWNSSS